MLDEWQQEVLSYKGDILLCTGRRVGKTYVLARKAAERMVSVPGTQIVIASLTEDQAKLIIVMILQHLEEYYKTTISKGKDKPTLNKVTLRNKSSALARPVGATGNAIRGFNGDVLILDEVSRFNDLIMISATPILLTTGGEIWCASTPFGKRGYFWKQFDQGYNQKDPECRFKIFYKSSVEVIHNRKISVSWTEFQRERAIRQLEKEKKDMSLLQFGQEYLGLFLEELRQFFSDEWIKEVLVLKRDMSSSVPSDHPIPLGDLFLGVDVAGGVGKDATVLFSVARLQRKKIRQIDMEISTEWKIPETIRRIEDADRKYNYKRMYIDSGGMGLGVTQPLLENSSTRRRVEEINNSRRAVEYSRSGAVKPRTVKIMKEQLYINLLRLGEQKAIQLFNEPEIEASLKSVQAEQTDSGFRVWANDGHIVEALIRAVHCMTDKGLNIWVAYKGGHAF